MLYDRFANAPQANSAYVDYANHLYEQRLFNQAGDAFARARSSLKDPTLERDALLGLADARRQSRQTAEALTHYRALLDELGPATRTICAPGWDRLSRWDKRASLR